MNSNSTIGNNLARYDDATTADDGIIGLESYHETWWMQAIDNAEMNLLVNNSWRGTRVYGDVSSNEHTCGTRSENLHDNIGDNSGVNPDIIAIHMGTNDFLQNITVGTFGSVNMSALISDNGNGTYTYANPSNFTEAYIVMLHKVLTKYNKADVFCFTLSPISYKNNDTLLEQYNAQIRLIANYFGVTIVDLYGSSGITSENCDAYLADKIHPTAEGMDLITACFENALRNKYLITKTGN